VSDTRCVRGIFSLVNAVNYQSFATVSVDGKGMEHQNCPGSWNNDPGDSRDAVHKSYGDSMDMNDITSGTASLNVSATPFVPGKNVFAAEFVPSFVKPQSTLPDVLPDTSSSKLTLTHVSEQQAHVVVYATPTNCFWSGLKVDPPGLVASNIPNSNLS